jgi:hypothetical protein
LLAAKHKGGYGTALLSLERHRRSKVHQEPMEGMYHPMVEMCTIKLSVQMGVLCPTHFHVFLSGYKTIQSVLCFKKLICGMPSHLDQLILLIIVLVHFIQSCIYVIACHFQVLLLPLHLELTVVACG